MVIHDKSKSFLNTRDQNLFIVDIDIEFSFECVMDENASPDTNTIIVSSPVGFEGDWDSIPSVPVYFPESFSNSLDDSFGDEVGLLLQVRTTKIN